MRVYTIAGTSFDDNSSVRSYEAQPVYSGNRHDRAIRGDPCSDLSHRIPGWFLKNVAVDSKKARRTCSTPEGSYASSKAAFINCIHLSRAAVPIGKRACRMRN